MDKKEIIDAKSEISQTLSDKFSTKGDMTTQAKKSRSKLPNSVTKDVEYIEQVEQQLKHPKLRKQVDQNKVNKAKDRIIKATNQVEVVQKDYKDATLSWLSMLIINLIIAAVIIFGGAYLMGAFNVPGG